MKIVIVIAVAKTNIKPKINIFISINKKKKNTIPQSIKKNKYKIYL